MRGGEELNCPHMAPCQLFVTANPHQELAYDKNVTDSDGLLQPG